MFSLSLSVSLSLSGALHLPGHVFNMPHDNVKACEEVFGKLRDNHMMSPTLIQIDRSRPWSVCSAAIITEFLDRGHGEYLLLPHPAGPAADCSNSTFNRERQPNHSQNQISGTQR